jgi:prepilin-type N-terminal cleavage/methylation domain-containing protein
LGCKVEHMSTRPGQRLRALTLVELLLTISVIAILASMVTAVAMKALNQAKEEAWALEAVSYMKDIRARLAAYYDSTADYPALTADELRQSGVFDNKIMEFLRSPKVSFFPFSSSDPGDMYVIQAWIHWRGRSEHPGFQKRQIKDPNDYP